MPGAYASEPPIESTRSDRSSNPPSAAKNGTCVVPAWVTSGPWPDTAALRMRSNWTSQPTSWTLTSIPVSSSNGLRIRSVSPTGSGPLSMIQSRSETSSEEAVAESPSPSSSPDAVIAQIPTAIRATAPRIKSSLFLILSSPRVGAAENAFGRPRLPLPPRSPPRSSFSRRCRRSAYLKFDRELLPARRLLAAVELTQQRLARRGSQPVLVLPQGRERRARVLGPGDVVEADHGEVVRDPQAGLGGGANGAERHQVRGGEHRGRPLVEREQPRRRRDPAVEVVVAVGNVLVAVVEPAALHLLPVAAEAVATRVGGEHARDRRDPAMAEIGQMPHGKRGSGDVVGDHVRRVGRLELDVDGDARDLGGEQAGDLLVERVDSHQDHAVDVVMARAGQIRVRADAVGGL